MFMLNLSLKICSHSLAKEENEQKINTRFNVSKGFLFCRR